MIGYQERTLLAGMTQSGKSELANYLFSLLRVRRIVIDSKGEWTLPGVKCWHLRARDREGARFEVDGIDWQAPIIHIRHAWLGHGDGSREQLEALFARIARLPPPSTTVLHEAYAVSSATWTPAGLLQHVTAGQGRGHGLIVCTQRPRNIATVLKTEASHVFVFPPLTTDDLDEAISGVPFLPRSQALELAATVPKYGYLWADRNERRTDVGDPLPDYLRADTAKLIRRA